LAQLFETFGSLVRPSVIDRDVSELSSDEINQIAIAVQDSGMVLLRGFVVDMERFRGLSERLCGKFRVHIFPWAREAVSEDRTVQTALRGNEDVPFHKELSFTPVSPDVVWFYCQTPPAPGTGATTVCDGTEVHVRLSDQTRALFEQNPITYTQVWSRVSWHALFGTGEVDEAKRILAHYAGVRLRETERKDLGDIITFDYTVMAAQPSKFRKATAFANSILMAGPSLSYGRNVSVSFENGTPISSAVRSEIATIAHSVTGKICWQKGDILALDNTRLMHGREPFSGTRTILTRLGDWL